MPFLSYYLEHGFVPAISVFYGRAVREKNACLHRERERKREPNFTGGKGDIHPRASFLLKNILPKEKETVSSSSTSAARATARGETRRTRGWRRMRKRRE